MSLLADLATRLHPYACGAFSGLFARPTTRRPDDLLPLR